MEVVEKHPRAIRWFHWIHFPLLLLMIWSGVLIYWANDAYIKIPPTLADRLNISGRLAEGMGWHFFLIWLFALNGILYVLYLLFSGEWKTLIPKKRDFKNALLVALHDFKIIKSAPAQDGKFNSAQKVAYTTIILMGGGALLTGFAIFKPVQAGLLTELLGGYEAARLEHFLLTIGFVFFFLIHIAQVAKAGWNNFRAMVAGYEIKK